MQVNYNQLLVKNLADGGENDEKMITAIQSIQKFAMSSEDNLVGVLTLSNQFEFYKLSTGGKHPTSNIIDYRQSDVIFLRHQGLWLGSYDDGDKNINFTIQSVNDQLTKNVSISLANADTKEEREYGEPKAMVVIDYHHNRNHLAILFKHGSSSVLYYYEILQTDELRLLRRHEVEATTSQPLTHCTINVDGTLVCCWHEADRVVLFHEDHVVDYVDEIHSSIKSIQFDIERANMLIVLTSRLIHHLVYLAGGDKKQQQPQPQPQQQQQQQSSSVRRRKLMLHETMRLYTPALIAYRIPMTFSLQQAGKNIISRKHAQLEAFLAQEALMLDLLNEEYEQFVAKVHTIELASGERCLWQALAKRCIKERDIETALLMHSKMGEAAFVRMVRQEMARHGKTTASALLALHQDMVHDVEVILKDVDKGQVSKFYQLQNKWHEVFSHEDKLSLKSAYFKYARQLEKENKIPDAVKYYEMSGNVLQIPKMFFETGDLDQMQQYCLKASDSTSNSSRTLITWLGQYCESQGKMSRALELYGKAKDHYNLVRLLCHQGQLSNATDLVNEVQSERDANNQPEEDDNLTSAILYLGKHLENIDALQSIQYYLKCNAILHAIRVCLVNELYDELVLVAVEHCSPEEARKLLDTYCKSHEEMINKENLVKLYYKSGYIKESIHFAIRHHLWDELRAVCGNEIALQARDYVVEAEDIQMILVALQSNTSIIDIVIDLTIMSDQENFYQTAKIIKQYNINLDESLMNKLEYFTVNQNNERLIEMFAELSLQRGNYSVAARLYSKIGNREESVKALIRSGNTDKVIQFANVARDRTVFKIAANFLQTINYPDRSLIVKFYTKANATQELDRFQKSLDNV